LGADLRDADIRRALLWTTHFNETELRGAKFNRAELAATEFINLDLSACKGIDKCVHQSPCRIDVTTLVQSGPLPLTFLRGVGLSDMLISALDHLISALDHAPLFYSCFISYSAKDDGFATRLHTDLQNKGVRCWFAPEDMKIGAKILDTLDQAIRLHDKVLLVLSEASIASDWVEDEATKAFEEERERGGVVLFPVRLDGTVTTTSEAWAAKLRRSRHIGDFRGWKDNRSYQRALERLLRDLRIEAAPEGQRRDV
jgi:hypothetical protein